MEKTIIVICMLLSLFVTILVTGVLVPILKQRKIGQRILVEGPNWHMSKEGTPTMGGISFLAAMLVSVLVVFAFGFKRMDINEVGKLISVFVIK